MTSIQLQPLRGARIEDRQPQTCFVATEDFTAIVNGQREEFWAGRSFVFDPHHEILRSHGPRFRQIAKGTSRGFVHPPAARTPDATVARQTTPRAAVPARRTKAPKAPSKPTAPSWRLSNPDLPPAPRVHFDRWGAHSPVSVVIDPDASEVMRRGWVDTFDSGLETGGVLLGERIGDTLHVRLATQAGPRAKRTKNSYGTDIGHDYAEIGRLSRGRVVEIGNWHTHPRDWSDPSSPDLRNWASLFELVDGRRSAGERLGAHVGLIVTGRDWFPMTFAYVVRDAYLSGEVRCERAHIVRPGQLR